MFKFQYCNSLLDSTSIFRTLLLIVVLSACLGVEDADLDTASNHRSSVHIKEVVYMIVVSGDRRVPK